MICDTGAESTIINHFLLQEEMCFVLGYIDCCFPHILQVYNVSLGTIKSGGSVLKESKDGMLRYSQPKLSLIRHGHLCFSNKETLASSS